MKKAYLSRARYGLVLLVLLAVSSCKQDPPAEYYRVVGETMGTYYKVKYQDALGRNFQWQIDSTLRAINLSVSTYIPESYISNFNKTENLNFKTNSDLHFMRNYSRAKEVFEETDGLFDPTVMPLVNFYGFGYAKRDSNLIPTDKQVDSLKRIVGMHKFSVEDNAKMTRFYKEEKDMQMDFSALAKGYAVDQISELLTRKGCPNHLVDIGGDGRAQGLNPDNKAWSLGVNKPLADSPLNDLVLAVRLQDKAMATSGNYRNYYTVGYNRYVHTINPKTALTEQSNLLSASLIAEDCISADAYATACMVMGLERSLEFVNKTEGVEACFIYDDNGEMKKAYSKGFDQYLINDKN